MARRLAMANVLPGAAVAEAWGDPPGLRLLPAEEPFVVGAVEERRREFTTVRACARQALAGLNLGGLALVSVDLTSVAITPDPDGAPIWPPGVVGSLTHCLGYRAAAVARSSLVDGLGIDAEPNASMAPEILTVVAHRSELASLRGTSLDGVSPDRLLWCAKEAAFKAWFPLTRRLLAPQQLTVRVRQEFGGDGLVGGVFTARANDVDVDVDVKVGQTIRGRWQADPSFILAAAVIPR